MRVLVTGAAGKLGSCVLRTLSRRGHDVRATDRSPPAVASTGFELADLLEPNVVRRLVEGVSGVVHLGNHSSLVAGPPGPRLLAENGSMNTNVFAAAERAGVDRLIFASSIQAMIPMPGGVPPAEPYPLPFLPLDASADANPGSNAYAQSKVEGELALQAIAASGANRACTSLRFPCLADAWWMQRFGRGNAVTRESLAFGEALCFLELDDAAELIATVLERQRPGYHCYLPAQSLGIRDVSVPALVERHYAHVPLRRPRAEITSLVDVSALRTDLGWEPSPISPVRLVPDRMSRWVR